MTSEAAQIPEPCEHAWSSHHEPDHKVYWVHQCQLCHAIDWDDLDKEIDKWHDEHCDPQ